MDTTDAAGDKAAIAESITMVLALGAVHSAWILHVTDLGVTTKLEIPKDQLQAAFDARALENAKLAANAMALLAEQNAATIIAGAQARIKAAEEAAAAALAAAIVAEKV